MTRTYHDHVATGALTEDEASSMARARGAARRQAEDVLAAAENDRQAAAFGMLDRIAVELVAMFGPAAADEVFRHYASVCARQADPRKDAAS